jgi:hypothetical protein
MSNSQQQVGLQHCQSWTGFRHQPPSHTCPENTQMAVCYARVKFQYQPQAEDELALEVGATIAVLEQYDGMSLYNAPPTF